MKNRKVIFSLITLLLTISIVISKPQELNLYKMNITNQILVGIFIAIILQFLAHYFRAIKMQLLIAKIREVPFSMLFRGQMMGLLFNLILPLRIGELLRARFIAKDASISQSSVLSIILVERSLDVIAVSLTYLAVFSFSIGLTISNAVLPITLIIVSLALLVVLYSFRIQKQWILKSIHKISNIFNDEYKNKIRMMAWSSIFTLKNVFSKDIIFKYFFISIIIWLTYGLSIYFFVSIVLNFSLVDNIKLLASSYLAISVPSGPAYLGTFQIILTEHSMLSADFLHLNNITFLIWIILVLPTLLSGFYILFSKPKKISRSKDISQAFKNKLHRDTDISNQFAQFLDAYFNSNEINKILSEEEHSQNFQIIQTFTGGSKALTLLVWQKGKMIVKKITLKQYEEKLRAQYDWLVERSKHKEVAKALGEKKDSKLYYSIDIEYNENFVPYFDNLHSSADKSNTKILIDVCNFMSNKVYYKKNKLSNSQAIKRLNDYISNKIEDKIQDSAQTNVAIGKLVNFDKLIVNGKSYQNFDKVISKILNNKAAMKDITYIYDHPIHGDLTVDNIIVEPHTKRFILLDPNNENSISDEIVDYAKLMQSLHSGYEFLRNLNECVVKNNSVSFKEVRSIQYDKLYENLMQYLRSSLPKGRYRALLFHEAIHYCRMLPYRCDINQKTAPAFYAIAIRLFNEFISQYE